MLFDGLSHLLAVLLKVPYNKTGFDIFACFAPRRPQGRNCGSFWIHLLSKTVASTVVRIWSLQVTHQLVRVFWKYFTFCVFNNHKYICFEIWGNLGYSLNKFSWRKIEPILDITKVLDHKPNIYNNFIFGRGLITTRPMWLSSGPPRERKK